MHRYLGLLQLCSFNARAATLIKDDFYFESYNFYFFICTGFCTEVKKFWVK